MKKSNVRKTVITITAFIVIYGGFILSGFLPEKVSDVTKLYSVINLQDIKLTYVRCDTNQDNSIMEIECDIIAKTYSNQKLQSIQAYYKQSKKLDTQICLDKKDNLIFQLSSPKGLPKNQAIIIDLYYGLEAGEQQAAEIVVSINQARPDCNLSLLTEQEYRLSRIEYDIDFYNRNIQQLTEEKTANEQSIADLQNFIASQSTAGKTSKEIEQLNQIILNNQDKMKELQDKNIKIDSDIADYQNLINETAAKRSLYE